MSCCTRVERESRASYTGVLRVSTESQGPSERVFAAFVQGARGTEFSRAQCELRGFNASSLGESRFGVRLLIHPLFGS
eukprot:3464583-Lingulodinium_polyedra.AAC.1